ncbi:hypothetical protein Fleli_0821 [Bernardetia litoralis DSM 6794]|uniref:DUF4595 domain-containing protein n=1 Tax=Bernardetia litoralis (strain ATCC 23117 / DSM 6794 / NBRC 15988 / NCIMB 1366 / Fx l1 / Sio-4) TaxID=880071 RepID=I4AH44_BERLS|nr:hypothetical protein [Bernardetia litoralis]AFM03279.1 hypothetical protein Fleli_0821 [Bernardetia litoralis DSM 6794]
MQTFRKIHSKLTLVALLFLSMTLISSCDTSTDDNILPDDNSQEIEKEQTIYTGSDLSAYTIDLPRFLGISEVSDLKLTTPPNFGSVEIIKEGIVLYRASERNNPRSDQFGYQINGEDGVIKIEYHSDSAGCETKSDYYVTTKNTSIDAYFLNNDFECMYDSLGGDSSTIQITSIEVDNQDLRNPNQTVDFVLYSSNRYLTYTPPTNFTGFQECLYTVYTDDNRVFTSTMTFEVLAVRDTCISLVDDIYSISNLPYFEAQNNTQIVWVNTNPDRTVQPLNEFYSIDNSDQEFMAGETYLYVPYMENDILCAPSEWDLTVNWNGIEGGVSIIESNYNPVFFIPLRVLQQIPESNFFYTFRNRRTGQEMTAEVVIRE